MSVIFRLEEQNDHNDVEQLTREAFWNVYQPGCSEHLVLHKLRESEAFIRELDFVAAEDDKIVANIVYSRMYKDGRMCSSIAAFGPVSVHPDHQGKGIGGKIITHTLQKAKETGIKAVMITGSPQYYCRFGFVPASKYDIYLPGADRDKENEFFMVNELEEGYLKAFAGTYDFDKSFMVKEDEVDAFDKMFVPKVNREARESDIL